MHDRIPVIIEKDDYDLWMDPGMNDPDKLTDLLKPFDSRKMRVYPVGATVSNVKSDGPECAEESVAVQDGPAQSSLF
jgi:putative SOS response-associated peptidase YedK